MGESKQVSLLVAFNSLPLLRIHQPATTPFFVRAFLGYHAHMCYNQFLCCG